MPGPNLKYRSYWIVFGYFMVTIVIFLSLTPDPVDPDVDLPYIDKFFHAIAYFSLMAWFAQIYHLKTIRMYYAISFIVMGILIEFIQGFEPQRFTEVGDMVANTLGVLLALLVMRNSFMSSILRKIEKEFF